MQPSREQKVPACQAWRSLARLAQQGGAWTHTARGCRAPQLASSGQGRTRPQTSCNFATQRFRGAEISAPPSGSNWKQRGGSVPPWHHRASCSNPRLSQSSAEKLLYFAASLTTRRPGTALAAADELRQALYLSQAVLVRGPCAACASRLAGACWKSFAAHCAKQRRQRSHPGVHGVHDAHLRANCPFQPHQATIRLEPSKGRMKFPYMNKYSFSLCRLIPTPKHGEWT